MLEKAEVSSQEEDLGVQEEEEEAYLEAEARVTTVRTHRMMHVEMVHMEQEAEDMEIDTPLINRAQAVLDFSSFVQREVVS